MGKPNNNLTVIRDDVNMNDRCTLIDTNLDARVQYVAHISYMNKDKNPIKQDNYEIILKDFETKAYSVASNTPNTTDDLADIRTKYNTTSDKNKKEKLALLAKLRRMEYQKYKEKETPANDNDPYFPEIETDKYYPLDHAMFVNEKRRYIADTYPYLLIPVILI